MRTIIEEAPWVCALHSSAARRHCHFCFKRITVRIKCPGCRFARYCSPNCMMNAVREHKDECEFIRLAGGQAPNERIRLLSRIITKLCRNGGYPAPRMNVRLEDYVQRSYFDLESREKDIAADKERMNEYRTTREQLEVYMANSTLPEAKELFQIYCRMIMNVFTITGNTMLPVGIGIYLALTQVKHSCCPNSVIAYSGLTAHLNYLGPTLLNMSELSRYNISYLRLMGSRDERRRALKKRYYFTCKCSKCMNDQENALETGCTCPAGTCNGHEFVIGSCSGEKCKISHEAWCSADLTIKTPDDFLKIQREIQGGNAALVSRVNQIYAAAKEFLEKHEAILAPSHVQLTRAESAMAKAAYFKGSYNEAISLYEKIISRLNQYMPENEQLLSVAEMGVSRLCLMVGDLERAKVHLLHASDHTSWCYGREHTIHNMVLRFLDDVEDRMIDCGLNPYGILSRWPIKAVKAEQEKQKCVSNRNKGKKEDKDKDKKH